MSDRARVALVLAIVAVLGGGAIFWFFKIYRPGQDLKAAQAEIEAWEKRFQDARECLLGKTPGSANTSEALAIREMTPDKWDRGSCTPLISKLTRGGEAPDSGLPAVETAWNELDKTAQKAALAFARHVSESTTLAHDPLPEALEQLDAARNKLRKSAELAEKANAGAVLPAAQALPIGDGKERLTELVIDAIPSAHGLVLYGKTASHVVQVVLAPGAAPKAMPVGAGSLRAVPDMTWGATPTATELRAGAFDAEGAIATPTLLPMAGPTVAAAAGTLASGVVVYGNATDLVVARAKDGAITAGTPTKIEVAEAGIDVDGRVALVWGTKDKTQGQILMPDGTDQPALEVPSLGTLCLTKDRVWGQNNGTAISFGGGRPVFRKQIAESLGALPPPVIETDPSTYQYADATVVLQGCTADAALFRKRSKPDTQIVCSDECRTSKIPSEAPQFAATTVLNNKLIAIASHAGVLGVWREGEQAAFYSLANDAQPVLAHEWPAMALTDGKVIDLIARSDEGFVIIRVPAAR